MQLVSNVIPYRERLAYGIKVYSGPSASSPCGKVYVTCPHDGECIEVPSISCIENRTPKDVIIEALAACPSCAYRAKTQSSVWPEGAEL